jgi:putative ABC transport system permease protein
MKQDLQTSWRSLRRRRGFAFLAVVPLAIAIGFTTAIFSIANALLLRPLPFPHGDRLMFLASTHDSDKVPNQEFQVAAADFEVWKQESQSFDSLGAALPSAFNLSGVGVPQRIASARATASLFRTLGIGPALGRVFTDGEERAGATLAVISGELWARQFGRDPAIVGRVLDLDGRPFTVIGVMNPGFRFGPPAEVWIPFQPTAFESSRNVKGLNVVGRLKRGVTRDQAAAEMRAISRVISKTFPDTETGWGISVRPFRDFLVEAVRSAVWILFAAAGFLLLIACANVSNLLLIRAVERRGETAVRAALGAGRGRLFRACLAESALIAFAGGILGIFLAWACLKPLLAACPVELSTVGPVKIDGSALAFAILVSALSALLSGAASAFEGSRWNLSAVLNDSGRGSSGGRGGRRFQAMLVAAEVGAVFLLVTGSAVAFLAFFRLQRIEPGFVAPGAFMMKVAVPESRYPELSQRTQLVRRMTLAFSSIPGVSSVAATQKLPLDENYALTSFLIEGSQLPTPGAEYLAQFRRITPGYLRTMGIRLFEGREFNEGDDDGHPLVAVVSRPFAKRYWPGQSPIGKRLQRTNGNRPWLTVVGVAADVRDFSLAAEPDSTLYIPYYQGKAAAPDLNVVIRSRLPASSIAAPLRERLSAVDRDLPAGSLEPLGSLVSDSLKRQRFQMFLMGLLAGAATLLAGIGLFGLISYSVTQQKREISIRMALGATASGMVRLLVGRGAKLAGFGLAGGVLAVSLCGGVLAEELPGTPRPGPALLSSIAGGLTLICLASSWLAARRAARISPSFAVAEAGTR